MRRRRPIRRPFHRAQPREIPPELRRANALMDSENYADAANLLAHIAQKAERRRGPRAPLFYLRAGNAYAKAGLPNQALENAQKGLSMIAARGDWEPLERFGRRAVDELNERGYTNEAEKLSAYLKAKLPSGTFNAKKTSASVKLPTHCPACGVPLHPDNIHQIDSKTIECLYCGNLFRGED